MVIVNLTQLQIDWEVKQVVHSVRKNTFLAKLMFYRLMFFHMFLQVTYYGVVVLSSIIGCGFPWDGFCLARIHSWVLTHVTHDDPPSTFNSIFLTCNAKYIIHSSDYIVKISLSLLSLYASITEGSKAKCSRHTCNNSSNKEAQKGKQFARSCLLCVRNMYSTSHYAFLAQLLCKTSNGIPLHKTSFILYNLEEVQTSVSIASNYHNPCNVITKKKCGEMWIAIIIY